MEGKYLGTVISVHGVWHLQATGIRYFGLDDAVREMWRLSAQDPLTAELDRRGDAFSGCESDKAIACWEHERYSG